VPGDDPSTCRLKEGAHNIRANTIAPGLVATMATSVAGIHRRRKGATALPRAFRCGVSAGPRILPTVRFILASDEGKFGSRASTSRSMGARLRREECIAVPRCPARVHGSSVEKDTDLLISAVSRHLGPVDYAAYCELSLALLRGSAVTGRFPMTLGGNGLGECHVLAAQFHVEASPGFAACQYAKPPVPVVSMPGVRSSNQI